MKPEEILNYSKALAAIGRPVAYYPNIGKALRNKNAAIMVCQFLYWEGKQSEGPGATIKKSYLELMEETGLTEAEIDNGRKILKELKIAEAKAKGNPAKLHWAFSWPALDKVLHDWFVIENGAKMFKNTPEEEQPGREKQKPVPGDIYNEAVTVYFEFCKNPKRMGRNPLFGAVQGKTLKDILAYLKTESINGDWPGAVTMLEYIFLCWDSLPEHYRKQVDLLDIRRNINNIIGLINNAGTNNKGAGRTNAAAVGGY